MKKDKKILFLIILSLLLFACGKQSDENIGQNQPNILILLADDLGYGELGSYGQQIILTPVLDQLAQEGMRFTNFYAGSPVCAPSRAVLMTGISSSNNTIRGNKGRYGDELFDRVALKKDELTLAEMLREAGYQTGFIGKWHLDDPNDLNTWAYHRGFDYAVQEQWESARGGMKFRPNREWVNGMEDSVDYKFKEWNCKDEFRTRLALDYLDTIDTDKPFFLFMSYRAPHADEDRIGNRDLYSDRGWPKIERRHAAKITCLDNQVGRLLGKLEELRRLDDTLVLFTSDNGPHHAKGHDHEFFDSNRELQGYKRDLYEGGIRVPFIAWWKGKIASGSVEDYIGASQNLMPTLAEVAGVPTPEQSNGISMLPVLLGQSPIKHEFLNWEFQKSNRNDSSFRQSARIGNLKAVRYGVNNPTELYDLDTDISEANDIASQYPEVVKRINQIFERERHDAEHFPYGGYK